MMRMGYKLARASVQGRVVLTRKMFLGRPAGGRRWRQSHTGSRLLLPACLAGAQATALHCTLGESSMKSSKTGGSQPRRGGLPLHWAPPLLQFQHKDYDYILRFSLLVRRREGRKYTNCSSRKILPKLYYKFTQLWCLVCSSKRSIYLPMENYGLQTSIFLFCYSFFCFLFFFFFCEFTNWKSVSKVNS